jgi:hypothetical protein
LDRRNLHILKRSGLETRLDDAMHNAVCAELIAGLRDDFAPMCEDEHATPHFGEWFDDLASYDRLAGTRWGNNDDPARSRSYGFMEIGDDLFLIGPKGDRHGQPLNPVTKAFCT